MEKPHLSHSSFPDSQISDFKSTSYAIAKTETEQQIEPQIEFDQFNRLENNQNQANYWQRREFLRIILSLLGMGSVLALHQFREQTKVIPRDPANKSSDKI